MKKLAFLALAVLACAACAPPPFDLELSLSARTARALTLEGMVGPVERGYDPGYVTDAVFIPEKTTAGGLDLLNGFVSFTTTYGDRHLDFISWDDTKKMYLNIGGDAYTGTLPADQYPNLLLVGMPGNTHSVGAFAFVSQTPASNAFTLWQADVTTGRFPIVLFPTSPQTLSDIVGSGDVIGVGLYPGSDPATVSTSWLVRTSTGQFLEDAALIGATGPTTPTPLSSRPGPFSFGAGIPDAAALNRALYYYDPDTTRTPERSYLSWYDTAKSRWRCWTWWSVSPWEGQELTGIDHRVDAVLSTGELFSTEGGEGRVYGRDGTPAASFPLTGLSFIEEASIDGTLRVLFSQYMYMNNSAWFAVYSIPTADLDTLKAQ